MSCLAKVMNREAVEGRLQDVGHWLLTRDFTTAYLMVLHLGTPVFSNVRTASVRASGDHITFEFAPAFWSGLRLDGLVGVLAHEAFHVLLRHVLGPPDPDPVRRRCWNLACDAVINDMIRRYYPAIYLPGEPITGELLVGHDCADMTAEEVLREVMQRMADDPILAVSLADMETLDCHDAWTRDGIVDGRLPVELEQRIQAIVERTGMKDHAAARAWGREPAGAGRKINQRESPFDPLRLIEILVGQRGKSVTRWVPPNSRLSCVYPRVVLPSWDFEGYPELLFAIDASASVDEGWLSIFAAIARCAQDRAKITIVSFDTEVYPFDPGARTVAGGGGTCFQAIEDYIATLSSYPDDVIVLTDGYAPRPEVRKPARWLWLLTEEGTDYTVRGLGKVLRVKLPKEPSH